MPHLPQHLIEKGFSCCFFKVTIVKYVSVAGLDVSGLQTGRITFLNENLPSLSVCVCMRRRRRMKEGTAAASQSRVTVTERQSSDSQTHFYYELMIVVFSTLLRIWCSLLMSCTLQMFCKCTQASITTVIIIIK